MSLTNVWVQTQSDGLVRADQITGIDAHQTPALTGKPSRWLLDIGFAEMRGKLDQVAAGQQHIADMLTSLISAQGDQGNQ